MTQKRFSTTTSDAENYAKKMLFFISAEWVFWEEMIKKMFHFIKLGWFFNSTALVHWWQNCIQLINILYCHFFRYAKLSILTRICSRKKNIKIKIIFNMYINNSDEIESRLNELNNMQIFFSYFCVLKNVHKIPVNIWLRKSGCFVIFNYMKCEW